MKNKIILHLQSGDGDEGGIANYISLLINSKEMKKYSHIVVVKKIHKKLYLKYPLSKLIEFNCEYSFINFFKRVFKFRNICSTYQYPLIHSHALRAGLICSFLKLFFNIDFIHTNHGLRFKQKNIYKVFFYFLIELLVLICSRNYVCIRNKDFIYLSSFIKFNFLLKKIKVIKLNLDIDNNLINKKKCKKYKYPFLIIGVGSLIEIKRPSLFIDWIKYLKKNNIPVKAIWFGKGHLKNEMIRLTKDNSLDIVWYGQTDQKTIYNYLHRASFLMQTSRFEVYPTVVLESFCFGTPVISSKYWGVDEIIKDEGNGIILKDDFFSSRLESQKLINLFCDEEKYNKLSNNCRKQFEKQYKTYQKISIFYSLLYEKVLFQ